MAEAPGEFQTTVKVHTKGVPLLLGGIVCVVAIGAFYAWSVRVGKVQPAASPTGVTPTPGVARPQARVPNAVLPLEFPVELVLDPKAVVVDGDRLAEPGAKPRLFVNLSSQKTIDALYNLYLSYFMSNGWQIPLTTATGTPRMLYGVNRKENTKAQVLITEAEAGGRMVSIEYVLPQ